VIAVRQYENEVVAKVYDIHEVLEGVAGLAILQPNDMLYVSRSKLAKASEVARQIADVALFNGWGTGFNFTYRVDDKGLQPQQNLDELINQEQPSP